MLRTHQQKSDLDDQQFISLQLFPPLLLLENDRLANWYFCFEYRLCSVCNTKQKRGYNFHMRTSKSHLSKIIFNMVPVIVMRAHLGVISFYIKTMLSLTAVKQGYSVIWSFEKLWRITKFCFQQRWIISCPYIGWFFKNTTLLLILNRNSISFSSWFSLLSTSWKFLSSRGKYFNKAVQSRLRRFLQVEMPICPSSFILPFPF